MVEKITKLVKNENGVKLYKNVYSDIPKTYDKTSGKKKKLILQQYTIASQINIMREAILKLGNELGIDLPELKALDDAIKSVEV